jgi:type IV pilus biogenesis protein PilP
MVAPPAPLAPSSNNAQDRNLNALENKVTDSVKSVVGHMGTTEDLTLEDLNTAKIAVAKIDALIDIEKRLAELDKLRDEREGKAGEIKNTAPVIPASALAPMPMTAPPPAAVRRQTRESAVSELKPAIPGLVRIFGVDGRYGAIVKMPDGQSVTVHTGDKLSDGSMVLNITASSIALKKGDTVHQIRMSGMEVVYGQSL